MWRLSKLLVAPLALTALACLVAGCAVDPLERLSQDIRVPALAIREQAVLTLANLSDTRAIEKLLEVLESDEELYDQAAVALVKKGRDWGERRKTNPVVEKTIELMAKQHVAEQFRARAAWVLGEIGDRSAIPALKGVAGNAIGFPLLAPQASQAVEKLGYTSAGRAYEILPGTLQGAVDVLPQIEPLPPLETG